jgi:hypothetical protein
VRNKTAQGFKDVTLDCLGTLTGWAPVGSTGQYEWTTVDLVHLRAPLFRRQRMRDRLLV